MFTCRCDVEVCLCVFFVILVDDGTDGCLEVKIYTFIQLEVSEGVHNPALDTNCLHFDRVLSQFSGHQQSVYPFLSGTQRLDLTETIAGRICHDSLRMNVCEKFIELGVGNITLEMGGRFSL